MSSRRIAVAVCLLLYWAVLFVATHLPPRDLPATHVNDKLEHATAYFLLSTLLYAGMRVLRPKARGIWWKTALIVLAYGAIDEWTQLFVGRTCDLMDWLADAAGVTLALVVLSLISYLVRSRGARAAAAPAEAPRSPGR